MQYNWVAGVIFMFLLISMIFLSRFIVFKVPAIKRMRQINRDLDKVKKELEKYPPIIRSSDRIGLITNSIFILCVLPFIATIDHQSVWQILFHAIFILMVYDFAYYLTHRFLFHGNSVFRKTHALHHQARKPSHIDAYYVHPLETFIGIILFLSTIFLSHLALGPIHSLTLAFSFLLFTQINIINHTRIDLPYFPYRTLNFITSKHSIHHENMHKGNYSSITPLYDFLFRTLD